MSDSEILAEAIEAFDLCAEREADNRTDALDDLRFSRLAEQWPEQVRKDRQSEGRPCLTINRLPSFIRQVVNDARQNKPAIIVRPVDSKADPKTAEIINGLIRNIEAASDADVAYDTALEYGVTCGMGYFRINMEYADDDTFDQDICIRRIANPFSVYGDPYSTAADSADWNTAFVVDTLSKAAFERKYKGADPVDWKSDGYMGLKAPWLDGENVMVAEYWTRAQTTREIVALDNGEVIERKVYEANKDRFDAAQVSVVGSSRKVPSHKVVQRVMSGCEVLDTVDWAGKYIPIIPVYGEDINVEGKRYLRSMVRDAKDPQRMFNYWRTAATELVALAPKAPYIGKKGAFKDSKWATANTQSHPYLEYDGAEKPERQPFAGVPAGALQEALNASDDLKSIMGLFDASLGAKSNETSGRAIMARQREGDVSSFHFIDNLSRSIRHAGRVIIDLIPHVYSTERMVRVLGIDGEPNSVPVNQPVVQQGKNGWAPASEAPEQADPAAVAAMSRVFDLTTGKYDVVVEAGPSFSTQREESATQMMELVRVYPDAAPIIGDILAKNLDWPGADEIADRLKKMLPPQLQEGGEAGQPQDPMKSPQVQQVMQQGGQMIQQLQQQLAQTSQELQTAKAANDLKARELDIKTAEAETDRIRAINERDKPSHLPAQQAQ